MNNGLIVALIEKARSSLIQSIALIKPPLLLSALIMRKINQQNG
jgi:hypothetical protein